MEPYLLYWWLPEARKSPTAALIFALIYLQFSTALAASGTQYALVILGFLMVFIILFVPDGILYSVFGTIDRKVFKKKGCMRWRRMTDGKYDS